MKYWLDYLEIGDVIYAVKCGHDSIFFCGTNGIAHFIEVNEETCCCDVYRVCGRIMERGNLWQSDTVHNMLRYVNSK